jgi:outer membrane protein W
MKARTLIVILTFLSISLNTQAQEEVKAFGKGTSVISIGLGIGNVWKSFLEDFTSYPENSYKVSNNGTFTLIYEYGVSKKISAGIAVGYSEVEGNFNGAGSGFTFTEKLTNFSLLARANYHIGSFKKFDPYVGGGLGYFHFKYSNDRPEINDSKSPGAFGYSAQLGLRYYVLPQFAAFAEAGYVGGSLVQLGLTYKLK